MSDVKAKGPEHGPCEIDRAAAIQVERIRKALRLSRDVPVAELLAEAALRLEAAAGK